MSSVNLKQTKSAFERLEKNPELLKGVEKSLDQLFEELGGRNLNNAERKYILGSLVERSHLIGTTEKGQAASIVAVQ
ncbi:hypothetical protein QLS71_016340 [Mariniflexile litorale]|uniref:Uncharacterized protein n=1 Tax=Mariniflexile litorale TaxID=3045158 RepID=A0AAU7EE09_9FLAO|nr:hypothetical protein [Mariniflexile sp. KMM 9835]MDQ8212285.1 hypothetical protein [Mariniflexile sp. KMM 9835]